MHLKGTRVLKKLQSWYLKSARVLPWRENPSPYRVWISEVMLQQTQVKTVIAYYERWMERFPDVHALAGAEEQEVLKFWAGLGYYSRARWIHKTAMELSLWERENGKIPGDAEFWSKLSGVVPYTVGAVLSIAYGVPTVMVDGNIERVFARGMGWRRKDYTAAEWKKRIWAKSAEFCDLLAKHSKDFSTSKVQQAWMELGATVCTPTSPKCSECPLQQDCRLNLESLSPQEIPGKKQRAEVKEVSESKQAWLRRRHEDVEVFLVQNRLSKWRKGLWDLPEWEPVHSGMVKSGAGNSGQIKTHYRVTNHKVSRTTLWTFETSEKIAKLEGCWVPIKNLSVPVGKPMKTIAELVGETLSRHTEED